MFACHSAIHCRRVALGSMEDEEELESMFEDI